MMNIVFGGAGINGFIYLGIIRRLEEKGMLKSINQFAGSSSGAFFATLLALGYTYEEMREALSSIGISEVMSANLCTIIKNLIHGWGLYDRNILREKLAILFKRKYPDSITFKELYDATGNSLVIPVTDVRRMRPVYFDRIETPNESILEALLSSIAAPLIFTLDKSTYYVDAGYTDNLPYWVFNEDLDKTVVSDATLVYSVEGYKSIPNIFMYIKQLICGSAAERSSICGSYSAEIGTVLYKLNRPFDFNLSKERIEEMIEYGYNSY